MKSVATRNSTDGYGITVR